MKIEPCVYKLLIVHCYVCLRFLSCWPKWLEYDQHGSQICGERLVPSAYIIITPAGGHWESLTIFLCSADLNQPSTWIKRNLNLSLCGEKKSLKTWRNPQTWPFFEGLPKLQESLSSLLGGTETSKKVSSVMDPISTIRPQPWCAWTPSYLEGMAVFATTWISWFFKRNGIESHVLQKRITMRCFDEMPKLKHQHNSYLKDSASFDWPKGIFTVFFIPPKTWQSCDILLLISFTSLPFSVDIAFNLSPSGFRWPSGVYHFQWGVPTPSIPAVSCEQGSKWKPLIFLNKTKKNGILITDSEKL